MNRQVFFDPQRKRWKRLRRVTDSLALAGALLGIIFIVDVVLNTDEGLRAAFYTDNDPAGYASLKQHVKQIDLLFPEWLHVVTPDGNLTSYSSSNTPFADIDSAGVHGLDHKNKELRVITAAKEDTEIFPIVNNFSPVEGM